MAWRRVSAVRSRAVEAYRRHPTADHVRLVADLLDDPHPQVRVAARKALLEAADRADHRDWVLRQASRHF